ncbi:MAG TPA: hypothetical protein VHC47_04560, partial [Mucilaginibacter sp.]|nr:hypothetical protein [Mucilaginibacter sp.]
MNKTPAFAILFVFLFCGCTMHQPAQLGYSAGFKIVRMTDRTRVYKPGTDTTNYLHYRPIDLDVWYPADTTAKDTALRFGFFLDLFGKRANYYTASKAGDSLPEQFAKAFCAGFKCSTPRQLLSYKTASYKDAKPASGKFPLIVYMTSYNGMGYENYKLLEEMAKRGYIVVSISSI